MSADGILIEIEPQLTGASSTGRRIGGHFEDGLAGLEDAGRQIEFLHRRTSTERACASRPSARASVVMEGAKPAKRRA